MIYLIFYLILSLFSFSFALDEKKQNFSVSLGVVSTSGNSQTTTVRGNVNYTHKGETWREYLKFSALYGESKGEKNAERIEAWGRLERRFFPVFIFWDIDYYRNPFQGYKHSIGTGPGVGIYIFKNEKIYLSTSYYVYRIYNELTDKYTAPITNYIERYFLHHIEERFRIKLLENVKFKQRIIYKLTSRTNKDYFITAENSLENRITKNLSMEISYNLNYQNLPVEDNIKKLDTIFITSIKYTF
ncbi:MAG: hypothetical protein DSY47_06510 [Hydrogenothermus sp.]|nr:MAG: hypothetical protein DSY47_06510 [Hydrogenothermus sp.]